METVGADDRDLGMVLVGELIVAHPDEKGWPVALLFTHEIDAPKRRVGRMIYRDTLYELPQSPAERRT
jgi:hypothetical protein